MSMPLGHEIAPKVGLRVLSVRNNAVVMGTNIFPESVEVDHRAILFDELDVCLIKWKHRERMGVSEPRRKKGLAVPWIAVDEYYDWHFDLDQKRDGISTTP